MSYREGGYRNKTRWVGVVFIVLTLGWCASIGQRSRATPENVEQRMLEDRLNGKLFAVLRDTHPQQFAGLRDIVAKELDAGTTSVDKSVLGFMERLEPTLVPAINHAPHIELTALRHAEGALIAHLASANPVACAARAMGQASTAPLSREGERLHQLIYVAKLRAAAAGRDRPDKRPIAPPTVEQWGELGHLMQAQGTSSADLALFGDGVALERAPVEVQCRIGLAVARAIDQLPAAEADKFYVGLLSQPS